MQITFFFRKKSPNYHSIEKLFSAIIDHLPKGVAFPYFAPKPSKGLTNRLMIGLQARKNQRDINHITGDIHFIALFLKRNKTILTIHDIGVIKNGNLAKRLVIKFFWFYLPCKLVKKITVISEFTRLELLEKVNISPDKIIVVPNCYPAIYNYQGKNFKNTQTTILQIGTKPNKNLERLILSLYGIDLKLIIVGNLSKAQLEILNQNQMEFENHYNINEQAMLELFQRCDILAYISTYEGFGMPVIEANAVGRPVLASNIEPVKSVTGNAALLVDPYNIDEIRRGIIRLIKDTEFCEELIKNGFENAKKYHPEKIAREYLAIYNSMMDGI